VYNKMHVVSKNFANTLVSNVNMTSYCDVMKQRTSSNNYHPTPLLNPGI